MIKEKSRGCRERLSLDKMKAMMNQDNQEEKLDQNEELAKLRANTSIEKTILSKTIQHQEWTNQLVKNWTKTMDKKQKKVAKVMNVVN